VFDARRVHMRLVVAIVALGRDFAAYFGFALSAMILPMLHMHNHSSTICIMLSMY